jgi:hypothetical protein
VVFCCIKVYQEPHCDMLSVNLLNKSSVQFSLLTFLRVYDFKRQMLLFSAIFNVVLPSSY